MSLKSSVVPMNGCSFILSKNNTAPRLSQNSIIFCLKHHSVLVPTLAEVTGSLRTWTGDDVSDLAKSLTHLPQLELVEIASVAQGDQHGALTWMSEQAMTLRPVEHT